MARKKKERADVFLDWPRPEFKEIIKTDKDFNTKFQNAMSYAHYELTPIQMKKEVTRYLIKLDPKHPLLLRIKDTNENRFVTVGKYMYIINNGGDIPENILPNLLPTLEKTLNADEEKTTKDIAEKERRVRPKGSASQKDSLEVVPKFTIQDRLEQKAREVAGEVEGWIDDFCMNKKSNIKTVEEFVNLFKAQQLKSVHMRHMQNIFGSRVDEIEEALDGKDKDLVEGYCNFTKSELKKLDLMFKNLIQATGMLQDVAKVERAPRKKKPVSLEKVVGRLKFKKEDSSLGIVSLNPVNILGSKEVWCFDTKTRKLIRYVADDILGPLSVKGASIIGFNPAKSISKTLRKPAEQLSEFKKCGKVQLRTFMDNIKAIEVKATGKINDNQLILKIS
jgi:hypothetical protein